MKRMLCGVAIALGALFLSAGVTDGPIGMDWQDGGHLYLLLHNGSVSILDAVTKKKVATIPALFGMVPVEIFSARVADREYVFVSGFWGRSGTVWQYTAEGRPYARFETPEQAASFDVDPVRHLLYVASPVTNVVYAIGLDQKSSSPKRVAYIREAEAVGPLVFDRGRNRVMVGDTARGVLYDVDPTNGSYRPIATGLGRPISLGMGPAFRRLFLADALTGRIFAFQLENGAFKHVDVIATGLRTLSAVTSGPDDTLFITDGVAAYQLSLKTKKLTRFTY